MASEKAPLDLSVQIETAENIEFEYRIAGGFRRVPAFLIDLVLRFAVWLGLVMLVGVVVGFLSIRIGIFSAFSSALILISLFLISFFYGAFFETWMHGQTPGKRLLGLRVLTTDGLPINIQHAVLRNLLRYADFAPPIFLSALSSELDGIPLWIPSGGVAIVCCMLTKRKQRIGDLVAGTMVVLDEAEWIPPKVQFEDTRVASLAEFVPANFQMSRSMLKAIALYAARRRYLSSSRRDELSGILAKPLMEQFGFRPDTNPDLMLCAIYHREFVLRTAEESEIDSWGRPPAENTDAVLLTPGNQGVVQQNQDVPQGQISTTTSVHPPPSTQPPALQTQSTQSLPPTTSTASSEDSSAMDSLSQQENQL